MEQSALKISVIICAYTEDRWNELVAAVESVQCQSVPAHEIIVIVDHNPALLERTRTRFPGVLVLDNREARGLSGARNSGIAAARGDICAFLDDDAIAASDWLEQLSTGYSQPNVIGVGGAIEPLWQSGRPAWFPSEFGWVVGCTYRGMPQTIAPVRNLIGCNMSLRRQVFDMVGGFRMGRVGALSVGQENDETELCIRAGKQWKGSVFLCNPLARVLHHVPSNRAHWTYYRARCYSEGRSKAIMSRLVGYKDGLASERSYTLHVLPSGIAHGLTDVLCGDLAGLGRAAAIVAGLAITTMGYMIELTANWFPAVSPSGQN